MGEKGSIWDYKKDRLITQEILEVLEALCMELSNQLLLSGVRVAISEPNHRCLRMLAYFTAEIK